MGLGREEEVETRSEPKFMPGTKVRSTKYVKNDGTYPGKEIGEELVRKGDEGYVRDIGVFLQRYYIYAVEFVERGTIVGMRGRELKAIDQLTSDKTSTGVTTEPDAATGELS
jgi:nitrogen fixation protein NifZ